MTALVELLPEARIALDDPSDSVGEVLASLAGLLGGQDETLTEAVRDDLIAREQMSTTGVGGGIAFPHARVTSLPAIRLALLRSRTAIEFGALDGRPVEAYRESSHGEGGAV